MGKSQKKKMLTANIAKEEEEELSFFDWLLFKLNTMFVDNIPLDSIKDLDPKYMYFFGFICYSMSMACFLYFAYQGYTEARRKAFIALSENDGECDDVARSVSGTWLASQSGVYQGEIEFSYPEAMYLLEFQSLSKTKPEFQIIMDEYEDGLNALAEIAVTQNLADNILLWITWQVFNKENEGVRRFQMNADPRSVFDNQFIFGQMATVDAECYVSTSVSTFDRANGLLSNLYSYTDYMSNPNCSVIDPVTFGYSERFFGDQFIVEMDVSTAITAIGVNKGILPLTNLEKIVEKNHDQSGVQITKRIDNRIPEMTPMYCLDDYNICLMKIGDLIVAPIYNHFGSSDSNIPCECGEDMDSYCNVFDFMLGFVYYPFSYNSEADGETSAEESMQLLVELLQMRDFAETNALAYNASWVAVTDVPSPEMSTKEWREEAYDFCKVRGKYCNVAMFNTYDFENHFVSTYYFNIEDGACKDTFTIENWDKLRNNPPTELVEKYYECVATEEQALFLSIGVAAGNTSTLVPIALLCILPFLFMYLQATGKAPLKPEYENEDIQATSEALALLILRVRDKKMRGIKKNGTLHHLTKELLHSAEENTGEVDSDDDSDDDDGYDKKRSSITVRAPSSAKEKSPDTWMAGFFGSSDQNGKDASTTSNPLNRQSLELTGVYSKLYILNANGDVGLVSNPSYALNTTDFIELVSELKAAMQKAESVRNMDGGNRVFDQARKMATRLNEVDLLQLDGLYLKKMSTTREYFDQIYYCIAVHTSIELDCSMDQVFSRYQNKVFYMIGRLAFSLADISKLSTKGSDTTVGPLSLGTDAANMARGNI